jgi:5-methylcytosine-specific restriction endonuclease McrA
MGGETIGEGTVLGGRFTLERELARTERLRVFRARDPELFPPFAEFAGVTVFAHEPADGNEEHELLQESLGLVRLSDFGSWSNMRLGGRRGQTVGVDGEDDPRAHYRAWWIWRRLLERPYRPNNFPWTIRKALLAAAGGRCELCGSGDRVQVDHIVPITQGGAADPDNGIVLCRDCHGYKHGYRTAIQPEWAAQGRWVRRYATKHGPGRFHVIDRGEKVGVFTSPREAWL